MYNVQCLVSIISLQDGVDHVDELGVLEDLGVGHGTSLRVVVGCVCKWDTLGAGLGRKGEDTVR